MALNDFPVKKIALFPPSLSALSESISGGLSSNFANSSCTVDTPPDLTLPPYYLAGSGLAGSTRVLDIGGPPNLSPIPNKTKKYNLSSIARQADMSSSSGFLLGAGAGPFHVLGQNSELMPNFAYGVAAGKDDPDHVRNRTHYAKIVDENSVCCAHVPNNSSDFAFMCNLFGSDGLPGPCLHVTARSRTGPLNFTESIQKALKDSFGEKLISIGGVFLIRNGTAKMHVMPDFPSGPFKSRKDVEDWLRFFDMRFTSDGKPEDGPLVCLSVFHSGDDDGLNLRMEHTHCFTSSGQIDGQEAQPTAKGGHYHYDLDDAKAEIEYEGWLNVAEYLYRIDQPGNS
jgi:hypothetical protein